MDLSPLIGRQREITRLTKEFKEAAAGKGKIILLGGEAGIGKTRLAKHAADNSNLAIYSAIANETATPPYGLFIDIFRSYLREYPQGFSKIGPIKPFLAQLLPEISNSPKKSDPNSLVEAILSALETIGKQAPSLFLLDDLHWADNATLELIPKLADLIHNSPIVILGIYRNDEIPRGHPVRRIKNDLRRANYLNEITIEALSKGETQLLAKHLLQSSISPNLSQMLYYKTQGTPFFVEELIAAMQENDLLLTDGETVDLISNENIPVPDTVRDAILIRFDKLSSESREYLEIASVVGQQFSFELLSNLCEHESLGEAIQNGFLFKSSSESGQFRHALTREAIYNEIIWTKARDLHKKIASNLELIKASPQIIAEHWNAGKESEKARKAYIKVVDISLAIHAYTDAANAAKLAINLWPEGKNEKDRLTMLDQLGHSAQLSGSLNDAARAWREAAESYKNINAIGEFAKVQRKLATLYGLQGNWDQSTTAHERAAEAFIKAGNLVEATNELIGMVGHLHSSGKYNKAIPSAEQALDLAEEINDYSLIAKARGYLGSLKTRVGFPEEGIDLARSGLSLALEKNLYSVASELYLRLAAIMEHLGDYDEAKHIYDTGINFCEMKGLSPYIYLCLACASLVSFQSGDFQEVKAINETIILSKEASPPVIAIAKTLLGISQSIVGELSLARENLKFSLSEARSAEYLTIGLLSHWGLALADCQENNIESAKNHLLAILKALSFSDESHYSINMLRFAASFFCSVGDGEHTRASADALAKIATTLSNYESLGGLAHALGEVALVNDDYRQAIEHFENAIDLITDKNLPIEEAESKYRAGLAYFALDQNEKGIELLTNAYQLLYPTGEIYYSQKITTYLEEEGISVEKLIGKREAAKAKHSGLTRRQLEVMKLIASGMTNKEIADDLVLSVRTVEMHVSNILAELGCRTRTEAATKASKIGLLELSS